MPKIKSISCHKVLNSRGDWTIETHVELDDGSVGIQSIPEGASKGDHEAIAIAPDRAVEIVSTALDDALRDEDPFEQEAIDRLMISMDGTPNKKHLGGNSILSVSVAVAKACAMSKNMELYEYLQLLYDGGQKKLNKLKYPVPLFNIINGGKHAHNGLSFQEFMIIPARSIPYEKSLEMGTEIYHSLKKILEEKGYEVDVGDEGGFAPEKLTPRKALKLIKQAASIKYKPGENVFFGLDVAAGSFYTHDKYNILEENIHGDHEKLLEYYNKLLNEFQIIYIEDPIFEHDHEGWKIIFEKLGKKLMVVADDLVVTNILFLKKAIDQKLANAVIVKPNQIGTLTETFEFIKMAKNADMNIIVSHRSGDTAEDTFIADLALAVEADFLKAGAPVRGERVAKYNRLLEVLAQK